MYAIIREENKEQYTSMVFAYYMLGKVRNYIVLDREKTKLMLLPDRHPAYGLIRIIFITDEDKTGWTLNEESGCLANMEPKVFLDLFNADKVPEELINEFIRLDKEYHHEEYVNIENEDDAELLLDAFGGFHDAIAKKVEEKEKDLYVFFEGIWGSDLEVWFEEDTACKYYTDYDYEGYVWYEGEIFFEKDCIYLVNSLNYDSSDIDKSFVFFKGKKMRYHLIPKPVPVIE